MWMFFEGTSILFSLLNSYTSCFLTVQIDNLIKNVYEIYINHLGKISTVKLFSLPRVSSKQAYLLDNHAKNKIIERLS